MNRTLTLSVLLSVAVAFAGDAYAQRKEATREGAGIDALAGKDSPLRRGDAIAFFGDSITQQGARKDGYCTLIADAIAANHADLGVRLIYAGVSGNKVPSLQGRLDRDVLSRKPTIVFIYIGINDVRHHSTRGTGTPKDSFEAGLRDLIKRITDAGALVVLATPSVSGERADGANQHDEMLEEFAAISRKVANDTGATLCDLRVAFIEHLKKNNPHNQARGVLTRDTVHLNEAGNQFVAARAAESIAEALRKRK